MSKHDNFTGFPYKEEKLYFWGMQFRLFLFLAGTKVVSDYLGAYEKDGIIQYIANGLPIYAHPEEGVNALSNFIDMKLCRKVGNQTCFHVSKNFYTEPSKICGAG